jgi:phytoene dehydrogenase-like protein
MGSQGARGAYDVVIVGGGHNGLTAAAYLARAGRSCLLLERREHFGGAAISERVFPGLDARLSRYSYLVSLLPAQIVQELELSLHLAPRRVASYTPDPRAGARRGLLVDDGDPAATAASFAAVTGGERDHAGWRAFYRMARTIARAVFPTLTEPLRSREQLRALIADEEAWRAVFEDPLAHTVAGLVGDDLAAGVILTDALIGTFAQAGARDLRQNRCFLYHVIGGGTGDWHVPVGGMGAVSGALEEAARAGGAELLAGAEVLALEPERRGTAVRFSDGLGERCVRAGRVLVGAAPAELRRLLGAAPEASPPEGAQLKLNMLLSRLPRLCDASLAPERAFAGTFHVNEGAEQLQLAYEDAAAGTVPALPPCETYCHSLTDPSILGPELRAARVHTLTVFGLHMPARLFAGDPEGAREAALAATLRSLDSVLAEPIEDCLMRGPDGTPCIEVRSPLDIEAELRMPGGHIFHRDLAWPFAEHEEQVGAWGVETEHPAILLCGAGARRGGGVSGVPGRNAAMAVLTERRRAGGGDGRVLTAG